MLRAFLASRCLCTKAWPSFNRWMPSICMWTRILHIMEQQMDFSPFRKESNEILEQFNKSIVCCLWVSKTHESMDTWCCSLIPELYTELLKVILLPRSLLYIQDSEALIYSILIFSVCSFSIKVCSQCSKQFIFKIVAMQGRLHSAWVGMTNSHAFSTTRNECHG